MNKKIKLLIISFFVMTGFSYAKRLPPPQVESLENNNFIYSAEYTRFRKDDYDFGVLIIESKGEVKYRFSVPLYFVKINKLKEKDVQWKFIKSMEFKNEEIITIINEENKVFEFNVNTYEVTGISEKRDNKINELYGKKIKEEYFSNVKKFNGNQPEKKQIIKIEEVIKIAENVLFSIYGKENIRNEMPYNILKIEDKWYVCGSLPSGKKGGVFEIIIDLTTSEIESVIHGK